MRRLPLLLTLALAAVLVAAAASASGLRQRKPSIPAPAHGLQTAIVPNTAGLDPANFDLEFARIRAAGATAVRLAVRWESIAPAVRPEGFDPTNPADSAYRWNALDPMVMRAHRYGLSPILMVLGAPTWAQAKRPPGGGITQGP